MSGFKVNRRAIEKMQRDIAKEFERAARKHPVRVPIEVGTPDLATWVPAGPIERDPHLSRLLLWIDDLAALQPAVAADVATFVQTEGLPESDAKNLALQLEREQGQHGQARRDRDGAVSRPYGCVHREQVRHGRYVETGRLTAHRAHPGDSQHGLDAAEQRLP